MKDPNRQAKVEKALLIICPLGLVLSVLTSLHPSGESEGCLVTLLSVGLPIVITICVIVLGKRVLSRIPPGGPGRGAPIFFMVLGAVAGLALLILRLTSGSDPAPSSAWAKSTAGGVKEMRAAILEWSDSQKTVDNTRWQKAAVAKEELRELSREDLHTQWAAQEQFQFSIWHLETVLVELQKKGTLVAVKTELLSRGVDPDMFNLTLVRTLRRMALAGRDLSALMEANFEDWRVHGIPDKENAVTPWQKKASGLIDEILALKAEAIRQSESAATPAK